MQEKSHIKLLTLGLKTIGINIMIIKRQKEFNSPEMKALRRKLDMEMGKQSSLVTEGVIKNPSEQILLQMGRRKNKGIPDYVGTVHGNINAKAAAIGDTASAERLLPAFKGNSSKKVVKAIEKEQKTLGGKIKSVLTKQGRLKKDLAKQYYHPQKGKKAMKLAKEIIKGKRFSFLDAALTGGAVGRHKKMEEDIKNSTEKVSTGKAIGMTGLATGVGALIGKSGGGGMKGAAIGGAIGLVGSAIPIARRNKAAEQNQAAQQNNMTQQNLNQNN